MTRVKTRKAKMTGVSYTTSADYDNKYFADTTAIKGLIFWLGAMLVNPFSSQSLLNEV